MPERVPVVSSRAEPRPPSAVSDQPVTSSPTPKPTESPLPPPKAKTPEGIALKIQSSDFLFFFVFAF